MIATTVAGLPGSPSEGDISFIRVGSGVDSDLILLVWSGTRWVGEEFNVVHTGDTTPVEITANVTTKQYMGDPDNGSTWGCLPPWRVDEAFTAGLQLEYRHKGFLQSTSGNVLINVGSYIYGLDSGEDTPDFVSPPTGGIAETAYLHGGTPAAGHSAYEWNETGWTSLAVSDETKDMLYPHVMGYMDSGTTGTSMVGYALFMRWVS